MQIHFYHQPIFFIARRLITPLINNAGLSTVALGTYRFLWFFATNSVRTVGLPGALYLVWNLRGVLTRRITPRVAISLITNYVPLLVNNSLIRSVFSLSRTNHNLAFLRIINWIMLSIIGNMFTFFIKRFIFFSCFGFISSFFSIITATLGIFWIPQLRNIQSFINFYKILFK